VQDDAGFAAPVAGVDQRREPVVRGLALRIDGQELEVPDVHGEHQHPGEELLVSPRLEERRGDADPPPVGGRAAKRR